jgi:predicted N-acetyltransferase YhbS
MEPHLVTGGLEPLRPEQAEEVLRYWQRAHPLHPLELWMLTERLFGPPQADPGLLLAARGAGGQLVGLAAGVDPVRADGIGHVRWVGALPGPDWRTVLRRLLDEVCARLLERGVREIHLFAAPPYYLRPGVDIRETVLIAALQEMGWGHSATHFNMTCDLAAWSAPGDDAIFGEVGGYRVRRADPGERAALRALIEREWGGAWRDAVMLGLGHEPADVFVAEKGRELVGFAANEVDQCVGSFGPTGVARAHRGRGLGARLLWSCLDDLRKKGRTECQIGWVGPVGFYHRACGAVLGPAYWMMSRSFPNEP